MIRCGKCKQELRSTPDCSLCKGWREWDEKVKALEAKPLRWRVEPVFPGTAGMRIATLVEDDKR